MSIMSEKIPSILHIRPQGAIFAMDYPFAEEKKYSFKPMEESGSTTPQPCEMAVQSFLKNEKLCAEFKKNDFITQVKEANKWGNSFDDEVKVLMDKTNDFYSSKSAPVAISPQRKVSNGSHHNVQKENRTPDIFDNIDILLDAHESPLDFFHIVGEYSDSY